MVLYPRREISGSHDKSVLTFWGINTFGAAALTYIPTRKPRGSSFSAPLSASGIHSERQPSVQMKRENGFSDSQGVSAFLGSHRVLWQRASPPVWFVNLFFQELTAGKSHFSENLEVQTYPDSPSYKPSLSCWHDKEKTLKIILHTSQWGVVCCLGGVLGVFPMHLAGCDFVSLYNCSPSRETALCLHHSIDMRIAWFGLCDFLKPYCAPSKYTQCSC